ncbi:MAG TPA: DUF4386 domain-containing protein [Chthoniobacterales bacterium]|jgi:hypothetical protein|nr:DUF4386 domain-containing protein [Chthoniobacterales bacterium]
MAGFFWLMTIITGMFGFVAGGRFVVAGDAVTTAANIINHEGLYRLAFISNLVATGCYLAVTLFIYQLLKPVNRTVAAFVVLFSLMGCAAGLVSSLLFLAPLDFLSGASYLSTFTAGQLQSLALSLLTLSLRLNDIGMAFFGLHVFSIGYLIRKSTFLPRILGTLLFVAGACYLASSFANFLSLPFRVSLTPFVALGGLVGEGSLTAWLLAKGINVPRWNEQAAANQS